MPDHPFGGAANFVRPVMSKTTRRHHDQISTMFLSCFDDLFAGAAAFHDNVTSLNGFAVAATEVTQSSLGVLHEALIRRRPTHRSIAKIVNVMNRLYHVYESDRGIVSTGQFDSELQRTGRSW